MICKSLTFIYKVGPKGPTNYKIETTRSLAKDTQLQQFFRAFVKKHSYCVVIAVASRGLCSHLFIDFYLPQSGNFHAKLTSS